ncbi:MAG TPA: hypothetical protein VGL58_20315 [Caulobacteraceae bacterium]|jgi:tetratricopeptide (TPR) repeat protein
MRNLAVALCAFVLAACQAGAAPADDPHMVADRSVAAPLTAVQLLLRQGDEADAVQALTPIVAPDVLDRLSPELGHRVVATYALAALDSEQASKAHWAYQIATQSPLATTDDWLGRLMSAAVASDPEDAYAAFEHLRLAAPDHVRTINQRVLVWIDQAFGALPNAAEAQLQLAQVLSPLSNLDPRVDLNPIWLQGATAALANGDEATAMSFARRIGSPLVMAQLRADRRFDELVAKNPAAFNVHAVGAAELARAQKLAGADPDHRAPQYAVAVALERLGRYSEALDELDAAMAAGPAWREDDAYQYDLIARKVTVLSELGRNDEALAITSAMCALCTDKVRFDMQQAHILIGLNRPGEALAMLRHRQPESLDMAGAADLAALRACALHGVGRQADAAAQLADILPLQRADPDAYLGAVACAGSDEEIAMALVNMLGDPQLRAVALGALQVYREGQPAPLTAAFRDRLAKIAQRPDVQAALLKVGRVETYDFPRYAIVG